MTQLLISRLGRRAIRQLQYGVTPPIVTTESTSAEKEVTATLLAELRRQGTYESEEEAKLR